MVFIHPEATTLGCSFNEIKNRIVNRGKHIAPFAAELSPAKIADSIHHALYSDDSVASEYFGIPYNEFCNIIHSNNLLWAPDGDEAFDDGSFIFQFDIKDYVRIIGCKYNDSFNCDPDTLTDIRIEANEFYTVLMNWYDKFEQDWKTYCKIKD